MFKEWRDPQPSVKLDLPSIEDQKKVFAGLKWQHDFHMRTAEADISGFRCEAIGLTKIQRTAHLDPDNPTGMYQLGETTTTFRFDNNDAKLSSLAEVAAVLLKK